MLATLRKLGAAEEAVLKDNLFRTTQEAMAARERRRAQAPAAAGWPATPTPAPPASPMGDGV